jgi:hypothetical protein
VRNGTRGIMIVKPMVFRRAITRRGMKDVRPTDMFDCVGPADLFIEKLYLCKKSLSYYFPGGVVA